MNMLTIALLAFMAVASFPAWAGPNWEVIHQERRDEASAFKALDAAPIDHGPRPLTTQWLNQTEEKKQLSARHEKKKSILSAGKPAPTHS